MKNGRLIFGILLALCATVNAGWIPEELPPEMIEQAKSLRSVIVVFKEALPEQPVGALSDEGGDVPSLFSSLGGLKKMIQTSTSELTAPLSDGGASPALISATRNLNHMYKAELTPDTSMGEALRELLTSPLVEYAEPDWPLDLYAAPNDEHFDPEQWSLNNTGQTHHNYSGFEEAGTDDSDIARRAHWPPTELTTTSTAISTTCSATTSLIRIPIPLMTTCTVRTWPERLRRKPTTTTALRASAHRPKSWRSRFLMPRAADTRLTGFPESVMRRTTARR